MRPKQYYFMMVSNDRYELPLCIAESVKELAEMVGIKPNSITVALLRGRKKGNKKIYAKKYKFIKVEISDEYDSAT